MIVLLLRERAYLGDFIPPGQWEAGEEQDSCPASVYSLIDISNVHTCVLLCQLWLFDADAMLYSLDTT